MDYLGNSISNSSDIDALETRVTTLETEQKTNAANISTNTTNIGILNQRVSYIGDPIVTSSAITTNLTPTLAQGLKGSLFISPSTFQVGMSFRFTVYGDLQASPSTPFRLFISQDALGNFPMSTVLNYQNTGVIPAPPQPRKWEFIVTFKTITSTIQVLSSNILPLNGECRSSVQTINPISSGLSFYLIGNFAVPAGPSEEQQFRLLTLNMERIF